MDRAELIVGHTWDGDVASAAEHVRLVLHRDATRLEVQVEATFHGDPAPAAPPGSTDRLWEYEVVELFLLGEDERYLELEFGPHGHYLVLRLRGPRGREESGLAMQYAVAREGERWTARAALATGLLPAGLHAANAYAIHGVGAKRRYLAAAPVPGAGPDFHRLECFPPLVWSGGSGAED